jgi:hypothetical protein
MLGLAIGVATTAVPMWLAETAPADVRGRIMAGEIVCVVAGQVLAGLANVIAEESGDKAYGVWRMRAGSPARARP